VYARADGSGSDVTSPRVVKKNVHTRKDVTARMEAPSMKAIASATVRLDSWATNAKVSFPSPSRFFLFLVLTNFQTSQSKLLTRQT